MTFDSDGPTDVVRTLRGQTVIFTGTLYRDGQRWTRDEAAHQARAAGAIVSRNSRARVSGSTDILVRGESGQWSAGHYGDDESAVRVLQGAGHRIKIIDVAGFGSLLQGGWAYPIAPHADPISSPSWTAPYRPANVERVAAEVEFVRDLASPTNAHMDFQNGLAERVVTAGLAPLRSARADAMFDLGWEDARGRLVIVEVKTLATAPVTQLRLGLGQILDYGTRIDGAELVLAVDRRPPDKDHWTEVCGRHKVRLVWPEVIESLLFGER